MKVLYLDESGDHSLTAIDPQYPVFVLGGVILDFAYAAGEVEEKIRTLKRDTFGREDLILHTADIARAKNGFESLKNQETRAVFHERMNDLMRSLEYQLVACAIWKEGHLAMFGKAAQDPYMYSLGVLLERFCVEIEGQKPGGLVIAEKRGEPFDSQLDLAWEAIKENGTQYASASKIKKCVVSLAHVSKRDNIGALQMADLVVSPIGRHVMGKPPKDDFRIIEQKFLRGSNGSYKGYGLVIMPAPQK